MIGQKNLHFLLIFSFICSCFSTGSYDLSRYVVLQDKDFYTQCNNADTSNVQTSGDALFSEIQPSYSAISTLMVTGWFLMKGQLHQDYPLFQILNSQNNVFKLTYNPSPYDGYFTYKIFTSIYPLNTITIINNEWYFIKIKLTFTANLDLHLRVIQQGVNLINELQSKAFTGSDPSQFIRNTMSVTYQNSCSIIRYLIIYMAPQSMDDIDDSNYTHKESVDTYLLWSYDKFQRQSTGQTFHSTDDPTNEQFIPSTMIDSHPLEFQQKQNIILGPLSGMDESGFIVKFSFKVKEPISSQIILLHIYNYSNQFIQLYIASTSVVFLALQAYTNENIDCGVTVSVGIWYYAVLIVNDVDKLKVELILKDTNNIAQKYFTETYTIRSSFNLQFGKSSNSHIFTVDQVRVYRGTFVTQTTYCFLTTARKERHCLMTNAVNTNLQVLESANLPQYYSYDSPVFYDWMRRDCTSQVTYSPNGSCMNTYFQQSSTCEPISGYCNTCKKQSKCKYHSDNRDPTSGACQSGYFDDGFLCISDANSIPNRNNYSSQSSIGILIGSSILAWNSKSSSIFVSFFLKPVSTTTPTQEQLVCFIREKGASEYIDIILQQTSSEPQNEVHIVTYKESLGYYQVSSGLLWIGLWTDFTNTVIFIGSQGQVIKKTHNTNLDYVKDIEVCVGQCTTASSSPSLILFLGAIQYQMTVIKDMVYSDEYFERFYTFNGAKAIIFIQFEAIKATVVGTSITLKNIVQTYSSTMTSTLSISNGNVNALKGLSVNLGSQGTIGILAGLILDKSVSMSVYIESLSGNTSFFQQDNSLWPTYLFVQHRFEDQVAIQICIQTMCKTTSYAVLTKNTPQFLGRKQENV